MNNICINSACKMSATCVHAIEYNKVANDQAVISVINPKSQIMDDEGKCQNYRTLQKVVYAYGFENEMKKMTHPMYKAFTSAMIRAFNRTDFYAMRNGTKAISPERQQHILSIATSLGCPFSLAPWDKREEVME